MGDKIKFLAEELGGVISGDMFHREEDAISLDDIFQMEDDHEEDNFKSIRSLLGESYRYDGKLVGKDSRLQYARGYFKVDELHQKGKRKLRTAELAIPPFLQTEAPLLTINIVNSAKIKPVDTYDQMKKKIKKEVESAYAELVKTGKWKEYAEQNKKWFGKDDWRETQVSALSVVPEGVDPIEAMGKDFVMNSEWTEFSAYSPDSDFQSHDPHFTMIRQKSSGAARKLFRILKADPTALKSVSWSNISDWLKKKKVGFDYRFSTWS